jgi:hypothetical protein
MPLKNSMKLTSLLVIAVAALLVGCSSTPTKVNTGAIKAATFSFVAAPSSDASFADKRAAVHELIHAAITQNLTAKGLRRMESGGDLTVAYLVIVGNNASTEAINTYFGYGRDTEALHEKAQNAYSGSKNPNYFEAGTLVIDLIDSRTFKLVERNYVTRPVLRDATSDARAANIQSAVDETLKNVRFAK